MFVSLIKYLFQIYIFCNKDYFSFFQSPMTYLETKPRRTSSDCANGQCNHVGLPMHLKNWTNPLTAKVIPTYHYIIIIFGYLQMMSLPIPGDCGRPCVCEGTQARSLLIDEAPSARVISSAWGLTSATPTISHFPPLLFIAVTTVPAKVLYLRWSGTE